MMTRADQRELAKPSSLLGRHGELQQVGWAQQPILDCNLEQARFYRLRWLQRFRLKRWDYYGLTTPDMYFSATLAHLGYAGLVFVYVIDLASGDYHEETLLVPLGRGIVLARNSDDGDSWFDNGRVRVSFRLEEAGRRVQLEWPGFLRGQRLAADIMLRKAHSHESMVIVIPIGRRRFYYNRKTNCLPASGWVERGGEHVAIRPENCLGNLDWGRGVWDYSSFWVWASASGLLPDGRSLGINLGYGFGDTSAATENAFVLDGRLHKLGEVGFSYDPRDFMKAWRMESADGRLALSLAPFTERIAKSNVLVVNSEVHQMFGRYQGFLVSDEGERLEVRDLIGFAEEHQARW